MNEQPTLCPPKARARAVGRRSERGAMAMLVGIVIIFVTVPLMAVVVFSGFLLNTHLKLTNYADAVTAAWGLQMSQVGQQQWSNRLFDPSVIAAQQGYGGTTPAIGSSTLTGAPVYTDANNHYAPAYIETTVTVPFEQAAAVTKLLPSAAINSTLTQISRRRVNQITLVDKTVYRQPVMLMLDTSSTMRLPYRGSNAQGSESAGAMLQQVAKQLIDESTLVYDLGVMGFSDGSVDRDQVAAPGSEADSAGFLDAWSQEMAHRTHLAEAVQSWSSDGNGTDIQKAIGTAATALSNAVPSLFQKPLMILITDGEPNISSSAPQGSTSDLEIAQQRAAQDATDAMKGQWDAVGPQGAPAYVDSMVLQMQREGVMLASGANLNLPDEEFLKGIAGDHNHPTGNSNSFHQDGGDPTRLTFYLQNAPKYPFCQFEPLSDVQGLRPNNASAPDPNHDIINAFVFLPDQQRELVIPQEQIFTDYDKFNDWASDPAHAAYLTPGSDIFTQNITTQPLNGSSTQGIAVLDQPEDSPQNVLAMYYDAASKQVWVSGMLCMAMSLPILNPVGRELQLRLRYGYPQLANHDDAARGGS